MHEYSVVSALIDEVEKRAKGAGALRVALITVKLGAQSGVDPRLLATAFETFSDRGLCAGAELVLEEVPARWACPRCGEAPAPGGPLRCARCERPLELKEGDEILLAHLELEVPDHVY
ncbi:MAG: hydrogenase maturation nickel metallochaperone HypA [Myxococcaceae bacterium]|nr:hydrogenase maturation nickel metallochaperone HypA [Myxococcaceae bacterium]